LRYPCQKVGIDKLVMTHEGVIESLCEHCRNKDCTNPIQLREISVFGVMKKMRLYVASQDPLMVVKCEGYI